MGKPDKKLQNKTTREKKLFQLPVSPKFLPIIWWAKIGSIMYIMSVIIAVAVLNQLI